MNITVEFSPVIGNLQALQYTYPAEIARALYAEALAVQTVSMEHTPVEFGTLRASHTTTTPQWKAQGVEVQIRVGGPDAPYAVAVHERVQVEHAPPTKAKFLQSAVEDAAATMLHNLAGRLKLTQGMI